MEKRRFLLSDLMVLIGAIALGTAWWKTMKVFPYYNNLCSMFCAYASFLSVATLLLRLRSPRPGLFRLGRQPGFNACFLSAAIVVLAIPASFAIGEYRAMTMPLVLGTAYNDVLYVQYCTINGWLVAGSWVTLRLSGRWHPEPTWLDRLGRLLGWCWILNSVALSL